MSLQPSHPRSGGQGLFVEGCQGFCQGTSVAPQTSTKTEQRPPQAPWVVRGPPGLATAPQTPREYPLSLMLARGGLCPE